MFNSIIESTQRKIICYVPSLLGCHVIDITFLSLLVVLVVVLVLDECTEEEHDDDRYRVQVECLGELGALEKSGGSGSGSKVVLLLRHSRFLLGFQRNRAIPRR